MNRRQFESFWDYMRQAHGIALRCIAAIPPSQIDAHPVPAMRTPKELIVHIYDGVVAGIAAGVVQGSLSDVDEAKALAGIKTHPDLIEFARDRWSIADKAAQSITDAHLQNVVSTPWGVGFPGGIMFQILRDEFMHHRGQLYVYLRAMSVEPPMMWDFEHNDPEFQPRAATGT